MSKARNRINPISNDSLLVRPRRPVLGHKDTVWESLLVRAGWNDLPKDQQQGRVVALFTDGTMDICFDALHHTARGVFPDEVMRDG